MTVWTTPVSWSNGTLTAAAMNSEVRDHLLFVKGALDIITAATAADTGDSTYLLIKRPLIADVTYEARVTGDTNPRFRMTADGTAYWGPGGGTAVDTKLERLSGGLLRTDSPFRSIRPAAGNEAFGAYVTGDGVLRHQVNADGAHNWGGGVSATDAVLERIAAGILRFTETRVRATAAAAATLVQDSLVTGDAAQRWTMTADGNMSWGPGTGAVDANLYRSAANVLRTSDQFVADDGVTTRIVAGVVSDGSFTAIPASGTIAIDTTNSKIYCRVGATWKSVTLV